MLNNVKSECGESNFSLSIKVLEALVAEVLSSADVIPARSVTTLSTLL